MRTLFSLLVICSGVTAQELAPVQVRLALAGGKTSFRSGEPIILQLSFISNVPGFYVNTVTTQPPSPVDQVALSPTSGFFPWSDDQQRQGHYSPDYSSSAEIKPDSIVVVSLPLNALYRFDQAGHYTVHVVTRRVTGHERQAGTQPGRWDFAHGAAVGPLTTNDVSFDVEMMTDADDAAEAARLEQLIRAAPNARAAETHIKELNWLPGDASARAKIALFLHPPEQFYPFPADVTSGLWIARNRGLVVALLEQAMLDPEQPINQMLPLAIALKIRLVAPYDAAHPDARLPVKEIETEYIRRIAATLPNRHGTSLMQTAVTLLTMLAGEQETSSPEFQAAREAIVTHMADVNEYQVDWVLGGYGKYLEDWRTIPALEHILQTEHRPQFSASRAAVLKQLMTLEPEGIKPFVVNEVCDPDAAMQPEVLEAASFETLPEVNACLADQIRESAGSSGRQSGLRFARQTELAARFATADIFSELLQIYSDQSKQPGGDGCAVGIDKKQARGALLAYFARYDPGRAHGLLEEAFPISAMEFDQCVSWGLFRSYYSTAVDQFLRERLENGPPRQVTIAAFQMSQHGPLDDEVLIRKRLTRWREQWAGKTDLPAEESALERELVTAIVHGHNWSSSDEDRAALFEQCVSAPCRDMVSAWTKNTRSHQ